VAVAEVNNLREFLLGEIVGTKPCIEARQAEENSVSPVGNRCFQALPSSGGGKEFRMSSHQFLIKPESSSLEP
jgi:hypothetical protein